MSIGLYHVKEQKSNTSCAYLCLHSRRGIVGHLGCARFTEKWYVFRKCLKLKAFEMLQGREVIKIPPLSVY